MFAEKRTVAITTDASGAATGYADAATGRVLAIIVVDTSLDNTADFTITAEATAEPIVTLTNVAASAPYYPRVQVHDETGTGATTDGTRKLREPVTLVNDRVKIVIAQGGNVKACTVYVIIG